MIGILNKLFGNNVGCLLFIKHLQVIQNGRNAHSCTRTININRLKVKVLPVLQDNYSYLIVDSKTKEAAVVDPVDAPLVLKKVKNDGVDLKSILITHHHWDHISGNKKLLEKFPDLEVYGGDSRVQNLTRRVGQGDRIYVGDIEVRCLSTPGHTSNHICYYINKNAIFTGDTMFVGGCGKFLEGSAKDMYHVLIKKIGKLPSQVKVFCGHEYTVTNLRFANKIEPENKYVKNKLKWAVAMRENRQPTVPSTIREEKHTNPFMRVHETTLQKLAKCADPVKTMEFIRKLKDNFKG